jgi:Kdo2-lipid IVA lauroyltransferase/acyltransferase
MARRNRHLKRIKRTFSYYLIRVVIGLFRMMPRRVALWIGEVFGRIAPVIARKEMRLAREHLTMAFGSSMNQKEIDRLAREMFRYLSLNFIDTVRVRAVSQDEIRTICIPHHMERLHDAIAKGKGVVGLTSHAGCWELTGVYITTEGIPTSAVGAQLYDPRLQELLQDSREGAGIENIARGKDTREILKALKRGRLLGILTDQDIKAKGVFVDFFGRSAHTAVAPAVLSLRYGAPILPILTWRDTGHRHHLCVGEPITVPPSGDFDTDVKALTAACSRVVEEFIREHPAQWVWFHKRWKQKPPDSGGEKEAVYTGDGV